MSAWSTNGRQNAIVADALAVEGIIPATRASVVSVYEELAACNERSLHYRYGDDLAVQRSQRYPYRPGGEVPRSAVVTLAVSWVYQSCEHPGFDEEPAARLVQELQAHMEQRYGLSFETIDRAEVVWSDGELPDTPQWYEAAEAGVGR
ncbi:MAG: hypothetical protein AAF531_23825 [Actinomycetota bacterium]